MPKKQISKKCVAVSLDIPLIERAMQEADRDHRNFSQFVEVCIYAALEAKDNQRFEKSHGVQSQIDTQIDTFKERLTALEKQVQRRK
ncbi:MAG: hypothetical protein ACRCUY_00900 [Thermoguttaceae bacterium]